MVIEGQEEDVYIPTKYVNQALHGDTVKVTAQPGRKKLEGEVVEIIQRAKDQYIGRVEIKPE